MAKKDPGKPKERSAVAQLLDFAGPRRALTYTGCALSALSMLLGFGPYVCIWFVARDLLAVAPRWEAAQCLTAYGWWALAFSVASIALYFCALICTHLAAFRCASNIRKATTAHLMGVPLGYFDIHASGELRRIIDGCASATEDLLAHKLADTAGSVAMAAGLLVLFFIFDWRLGLACVAAMALSVICLCGMMTGRGMEFVTNYQTALVNMTRAGTEYVRGIPVVKVFQQTVYSFRAFHEAIMAHAHMAKTYAVDFCRPWQVAQLTVINGLVMFLVPVVLLLAPGEGDFARFLNNVAFYAVFSALVPTAMTRVMFMNEASMTATDALARVRGVLDSEQLKAPTSPKKPADASVRFDAVTFTYAGAEKPALDGVTFEVPAGSTVALVGPSGGGKSTAASLMPRFWDVDAGRVLVGGVDVRELDAHELMEQVAFVFQTNKLFSDTLYENVRAAAPNATRDEVLAVLSAAQCDGIVAKLPQGVDTMLGTGGAYLSGGEVQRVALARAILKHAPIVVLDEATAFADPENEMLIQRAFAQLTHSEDGTRRTVIMIAHRLSTVVGADKIVVLDKGRVAEQGTHEELLAQGGLYARMWAEYNRAATWRISSTDNAAATAVLKMRKTLRADFSSKEGGEA